MPCDKYVNTTHSTLKVLPEASNGDIHSTSTDDFELPSLCVTAAPLQILCWSSVNDPTALFWPPVYSTTDMRYPLKRSSACFGAIVTADKDYNNDGGASLPRQTGMMVKQNMEITVNCRLGIRRQKIWKQQCKKSISNAVMKARLGSNSMLAISGGCNNLPWSSTV